MTLIDIEQDVNPKLFDIGKINVLLGKNGCGKSRSLRSVEGNLRNKDCFGDISYIPPERGGELSFNANVERNMSNRDDWQFTQRRRNLVDNFRQQTISQFRELEKNSLREIEQNQEVRNSSYTFKEETEKINELLDQVKIIREGEDFSIYGRGGNDERGSGEISSGESELISLSIEILAFTKKIDSNTENLLLLDEPDVHLHPDLQKRLCDFVIGLVQDNNFRVIIATHSTAILGGVSEYDQSRVCFMEAEDQKLDFEKIDTIYETILPVFGAHPLSNVFNRNPILLLDGDDDVRIWQQAIRSSKGELKIFPRSVDGEGNFSDYERKVQDILKSVYDNPKGFSLRDNDSNSEEEIDDLPPIKRFRLNCREAENLLLTNEVLNHLDTTWEEVKKSIDKWLSENENHPHFQIMHEFENGGYNRRTFKIKDIRNDLMGIIGDNRPWEVAIGQTISKILLESPQNNINDNSIIEYLGKDFLHAIHPDFSLSHN